MSKLVTDLFDGLKRMGNEVGAELSRQGRQGANELASALFAESNAFVQYGTGQYTKDQEQPAPEVEQQHEIER